MLEPAATPLPYGMEGANQRQRVAVWIAAFLLWTAIAGVFASQLYFAGLGCPRATFAPVMPIQ